MSSWFSSCNPQHLLDAANEESRNELAVNNRSRIFWKTSTIENLKKMGWWLHFFSKAFSAVQKQ